MRNVRAIWRREVGSFFASPIAYAVATVFLVFSGLIFSLNVINSQEASLRGLQGTVGIILLFLAPVLSMRLIAEEQNTGTIELLLTAPVRDVEVVIGKYLASLTLLAGMLLLTIYYPIILYIYGQPDLGPILAGYLGVLLAGGSFLAVGLLFSSLTRNQIVAAAGSIGVLLVFWFVNGAAQSIPAPVSTIVRYLALSQHFNDFNRGVVDTQDVAYYLSFIAVFLFLCVRSLETRRWR